MSEFAKNLEGGIYNWLLYFSHLWLTHLHFKIKAQANSPCLLPSGVEARLTLGGGLASTPAAGGQWNSPGFLLSSGIREEEVMKPCIERLLS